MIGGNEVGAVETGVPDALGRLFIPAGKRISESSDNAAADGKYRFQWKIQQGGEAGSDLHARA